MKKKAADADSIEIGSRIKKVRESLRLSQKEVATTLDMAPSQYSRIEGSASDPSFSTIKRVAGALGVKIAELFTEEGPIPEDKTVSDMLRRLNEKEKQAFLDLIGSIASREQWQEDAYKKLQSITPPQKPT